MGKTALTQCFVSDGTHFAKNYTMVSACDSKSLLQYNLPPSLPSTTKTTGVDISVKAVRIPDTDVTVVRCSLEEYPTGVPTDVECLHVSSAGTLHPRLSWEGGILRLCSSVRKFSFSPLRTYTSIPPSPPPLPPSGTIQGW